MVIRVSRHGMTRCASCDRHIQVAAVPQETRCPFCDAPLAAAPRAGGRLGRTGGALAASLLALGLGAGCLEDQERKDSDTRATRDTQGTDLGPQPVYGLPMDVIEPAEDASVQPEYGLPMDVIEPAEDASVQPEYGLPMDVEDAHDTETEDIPTAPLYGLPADASQPDAGPEDVQEDTTPDTDDGIPGPLYGLPPG